MANVRIKDITTTASAPNDDDYLAIDGATSGTRKISASSLNKGDGVTEEIKQALLQIASKVAYIDEHGQDYYDALYGAFYPLAESITAAYTQSDTVYSTTPLNDLKSDLAVTVNYSDGTSEILSNSDYALSGTLQTGTSVITVTYGNLTTSFEVLVTGVVSISAVYTQAGEVHDTDDLNSLKSNLVVTASLSDSTSFVVPAADYTLSGTLEAPSSTITVAYAGLTTTFEVAVVEVIDYTLNPLADVTWYDGYTYDNHTGVLKAASGEHCTSKFDGQNCIYLSTNSDTTNNRYFAVFAWDENDNYLGNIQYGGLYSFKKGYKYAIKTYNTGTFVPTTLTLMPKDNSSTAVSQFSIKLSDYIGNISIGGENRLECNVATVMSTAGVTAGNINTTINKCNYLAILTPTGTTESFTKRNFTFWFYNINTLMFKIDGVTTVAAAEAWITANNPEIIFNG